MSGCENMIWTPMESYELFDIYGGDTLQVVAGVACIVTGSVAVVGAVALTIYCPAAISETWKLATAGVAAVVSGAKILGY